MFDALFGFSIILMFLTLSIALIVATIPNIKRLINNRKQNEPIEDFDEEDYIAERFAAIETRLSMLEQQMSMSKGMQIVVNGKEDQSKQLLNISNLKIKASSVLYIASQVFEMPDGGDSRIKVIHYSETAKTDSVYGTFDSILEQLAGNFMLINKNQIINLDQIHKILGNEIFLNGVNKSFFVSDNKKAEFDMRIAKII